jgi:hypothetical protein
MRQGIENMRKLVYAFYNPAFSFKQVIQKYPDAAGDITDCLSGDVNKDLSRLWGWIEEFVPLPAELPVGQPLLVTAEVLIGWWDAHATLTPFGTLSRRWTGGDSL